MTTLPPGGNAVLPSQKLTLDISSELGESNHVRTFAVLTTTNRGSSSHGESVGTYKPVTGLQALTFKQVRKNGLGSFEIDLDLLPSDLEKVVFLAFVDNSSTSFADFGSIQISTGGITGIIDCCRMKETALILAEIYARNNQWKIRINGQGYVMGISALSESLGLELNHLKKISPPPPPPPSSPPSVSSTSTGRVSLTKSNKSISLTKAGGSYGKVLVNLNWNQKTERGGLFGRRSTGIDLDLGAFVETIDGQLFVIQALGNMFGSYDHAPFTRLLEDDRTGAAKSGEWLNINGDKWTKVKRVLVYAFIYEGVPNWQETDGIVKVIVPGQPEIEVRMNEYGDTRGACAVASLENINGDVRVTREVTFHTSQKEMDQQYGWGFSWTVGSK
jgi:tellurite resistance protein TerA